MNHQSMNERLKQHYGRQRLPADTVEGLRRQMDEAGCRSRASASHVRRAIPWLYAAAAVLLTMSATLAVESRGRSLHDIVFKARSVAPVRPVAPAGPAQRATPVDSAAQLAAHRPVADIIVLKFSADWCKLSNQLAPDFRELREEHDAENVLFVDLDLTDEVRANQAKMLVAALGIDNVWDEHGRITGQMLYVDPVTRRVVRVFGPDDQYDEMHFALDFAVKQSHEKM